MLRPLDLLVVGCDDDASGLAMVMVRCMVLLLIVGVGGGKK